MKAQNYSKGTKEVLKNVLKFLEEKYGGIQPEWELALMLLCDNLELYKDCRTSINLNGIYDSNTGKKNPLLATCKDLQATILKQIQHFGLSPYAMSKIKMESEDDSEDFIEKLTE